MKRGFLVFFIIILIKQSNFTKIEYVKLLIVTFSEDRHILHTGRFGEKYTYTSVFSPLLPLQSINSIPFKTRPTCKQREKDRVNES